MDLLGSIVVATLQEVRIIVDRINSLPLHHAFYKSMYLEFIAVLYYRPVTSRGHKEGRRVFREGPKYFELCPIVLNYVRHIFPGGAKFFLGGAPPWLRSCYIIISMMTSFMRVSQKLVFHQSKCISAIKRILSTTAVHVSSSSMYLRIPCY